MADVSSERSVTEQKSSLRLSANPDYVTNKLNWDWQTDPEATKHHRSEQAFPNIYSNDEATANLTQLLQSKSLYNWLTIINGSYWLELLGLYKERNGKNKHQ